MISNRTAGQPLEEIIGAQKRVDGQQWVVPLPHRSGASRWHQSEENRERVRRAVRLIGEHVRGVLPQSL